MTDNELKSFMDHCEKIEAKINRAIDKIETALVELKHEQTQLRIFINELVIKHYKVL